MVGQWRTSDLAAFTNGSLIYGIVQTEGTENFRPISEQIDKRAESSWVFPTVPAQNSPETDGKEEGSSKKTFVFRAKSSRMEKHQDLQPIVYSWYSKAEQYCSVSKDVFEHHWQKYCPPPVLAQLYTCTTAKIGTSEYVPVDTRMTSSCIKSRLTAFHGIYFIKSTCSVAAQILARQRHQSAVCL